MFRKYKILQKIDLISVSMYNPGKTDQKLKNSNEIDSILNLLSV